MSNAELLSRDFSKIADSALGARLVLLKKELFNLRFQRTLGELTNTSRFSVIKKTIASVNTELTKRKKNKG